MRTPHYYGQFALSLGKGNSYIFSYFFLWPPQCLLINAGFDRITFTYR